MPVSLAGFVKDRKHQFGRQATFGTAVAAVRRYGFKGVPATDPSWTDPDVDVGSIDPFQAPHREAGKYAAALTDPTVRYNNLPLIFHAFFGGSVTPTGMGDDKTWEWAPASDGSDGDEEPMTYEFGDDVTDDWWQYRDGILESFEITGPEGLGALTCSMQWKFGAAFSSGSTDFPDSPSIPATITFDPNEAIVFLKDIGIYIASSTAGLSAGQITDALHNFSLRGTRVIDEKRFANGSDVFDPQAWGTASRMIELDCSWAKTSDIVGTGSETDAWFSDTSVLRYVELKATSQELISTGPDVPYSADLVMPMRYYTREERDSGGNSVVGLTGKAFLDPDDLDGVFTAQVVNTLDDAGF